MSNGKLKTVNKVNVEVDDNGNRTYKLSSGTSVTLTKDEFNELLSIKNADGRREKIREMVLEKLKVVKIKEETQEPRAGPQKIKEEGQDDKRVAVNTNNNINVVPSKNEVATVNPSVNKSVQVNFVSKGNKNDQTKRRIDLAIEFKNDIVVNVTIVVGKEWLFEKLNKYEGSLIKVNGNIIDALADNEDIKAAVHGTATQNKKVVIGRNVSTEVYNWLLNVYYEFLPGYVKEKGGVFVEVNLYQDDETRKPQLTKTFPYEPYLSSNPRSNSKFIRLNFGAGWIKEHTKVDGNKDKADNPDEVTVDEEKVKEDIREAVTNALKQESTNVSVNDVIENIDWKNLFDALKGARCKRVIKLDEVIVTGGGGT
jgi:hypothetical protein